MKQEMQILLVQRIVNQHHPYSFISISLVGKTDIVILEHFLWRQTRLGKCRLGVKRGVNLKAEAVNDGINEKSSGETAGPLKNFC